MRMAGRFKNKVQAGVINSKSEKRGNPKSTSARYRKGVKPENPIQTENMKTRAQR